MSYLKPGTLLNRNCYKITGFMAQGGFGITYLAEEMGYFRKSGFEDDNYVPHRNPEKVVVKELYYNDYCQRDGQTGLVSISNSEKKIEFEKLVNKLLEEGKILRKLDHPGIVRTRDIFRENGTAYMVMDYIEGSDLDTLVKKLGKLEKNKALSYISQVLSAVQYIHEKKVLHLDITPSNILVRKDTDEVVLIDFGSSLTYEKDNRASGTTSKLITGMTRRFAPAEQADIDNLKEFDATFDTYAAGATLYYLITGQLPPLSSLVSTGKQKITPPSECNNGTETDEYLDAVILRAMAPKYHDRFSNTSTFSQLLAGKPEYERTLGQIDGRIKRREYEDALQDINDTENKLLQTSALNELRALCRQELEKKKDEERCKQFLEKAENWFSRHEYALAKNEFEKAAILSPGNEKIKERIRHCDQQEAALLADEQKKLKINELLYQARQHMADQQMEEARQKLNRLLQLAPGLPEAARLLKQLESEEKEQVSGQEEKAGRLLAEGKYKEARALYEQINRNGTGSSHVKQKLQLLTDEAIEQAGQLSKKLNDLDKKISGADPLAPDATNEVQGIRAQFEELVQQQKQLTLSSAAIREQVNHITTSLSGLERSVKENEHTKIVTYGGTPGKPVGHPEENENEKVDTVTVKEKMPFGKTVLYFMIGAAVVVGIGLLILNAVKPGASGSNGANNGKNDSTKVITTGSKEIREPVPLSTEDLSRIKDFIAYPEDFVVTDKDIQDLHGKILNAPLEQQNNSSVIIFEHLFVEKGL